MTGVPAPGGPPASAGATAAGPGAARGRRQWPLPKQADPDAPLLVVEDLRTYFTLPSGTVKAVDGVSFELHDGEALGIAGESGCGKTTTPLLLARDLGDLPGRDERPEPRPPGRRPDRGADRGAARAPACRGEPTGRRAPGAGRHRPRPGGRLPASALGRDAPAGDDRDGARLRSSDRDRRRADHCARRHGPGPDPGAAGAAPRAAWALPDPHHARPLRDRRDVRPGPRDVCRASRGGGTRPEPVPRAAPPIHADAPGGHPEPRLRPATFGHDPGRPARPADPASGLPVPPALPAGDGRLPRGRARGGPLRRRRAGRLPPVSARRRRPAPAHPAPGDHGCRRPGHSCTGRVRGPRPGARAVTDELLRLEGLAVHFPVRGGFADAILRRRFGAVRAVDGIALAIRRGEVLGLVGESGSGKTTTGRVIVKLTRPTAGRMLLDGTDVTDVWGGSALRDFRRRVQLIFQDPYETLNPKQTIHDFVAEPPH